MPYQHKKWRTDTATLANSTIIKRWGFWREFHLIMFIISESALDSNISFHAPTVKFIIDLGIVGVVYLALYILFTIEEKVGDKTEPPRPYQVFYNHIHHLLFSIFLIYKSIKTFMYFYVGLGCPIYIKWIC